MYYFDYCRGCKDELFVEKQNLEKAARDLLKVAREALPPDGEARARYESAVLAMETLLGEPIEK